jgi:predicted naringenin-chalcone synthase
MSRIISIGTALPEYGTKQSLLLDFMNAAYNNSEASRKLNALFSKSGISMRYSVVPDFSKINSNNTFFKRNNGFPNIEERLEIFKKNAVPMAIKAIDCSLNKMNKSLKNFQITHLITVSCTGLQAPGIDVEIMSKLNLANDIFHTSVNFLGCNAAYTAFKIADMIAKTNENAKILIICVELCTLHFQPKNNDDNLLSNTIFGDGAASVIIVPEKFAKKNHLKGLDIKNFYSLIYSNGKDLMGWNVKQVNFEMILNPNVPKFIGDVMDEIMFKALKKMSLDQAKIKKWAIHPGGKKILDTIKRKLKLNDLDLQYSYKILDNYGNMSSATILFVLNEIMNAEHKPDENIFSIGFGPGLSIETSLFKYAD